MLVYILLYRHGGIKAAYSTAAAADEATRVHNEADFSDPVFVFEEEVLDD